jgi:hypothetical protein
MATSNSRFLYTRKTDRDPLCPIASLLVFMAPQVRGLCAYNGQ